MPNIKYKEFLRKHTTEDIVNKMQEDAPANAVAGGGVDMNPDGKKVKKKKEDDAEDMLRRVIMNKLSDKIKEENDTGYTGKSESQICNFLRHLLIIQQKE